MRLEWDEAKRKANYRKHGIDFADLAPLFDGITLTTLDDRFDYGEHRFITLGYEEENYLEYIANELGPPEGTP